MLKTASLLVALATVAAPIHAQACGASTLSIDGRSNIFGAGHATPPAPGGGGASGGGVPPQLIALPQPGLAFSVPSVSGACSWSSTSPSVGAEGSSNGVTDVASFGGIGGIALTGRRMFLVGVFLDDAEPADPAPAPLDFTGMIGFTTLAPSLREVFFIGDGLSGTGSGAMQTFVAPTGATRLYLGFADAFSFQGLPGWYGDNGGALLVTVVLHSAPGVAQPLGTGCGAGPNPPLLAATAPLLGGTWTLGVSDTAPNATGLLFLSCLAPGPLTVAPGCDVWVDVTNLGVPFAFPTDVTGSWSLALALPAGGGLEGLSLTLQAAISAAGGPIGIDLTNGLGVGF